MNIQKMQISFLAKLKSDYNIELDIPTVQIEYYLNEAQRRIVEKYYSVYEINERARKVLSHLVVPADLDRTSVLADTDGLVPNGEYWELPANCMYMLKEEASLNIDDCEDITNIPGDYVRVYVKPINLDYYSKNVTNPFKKPYSGLVWRIDSSYLEASQIHMLVTGGTYRVQEYHIIYLAYPEAMSILNDVDCKLPDLIHQEIVDEAVVIVSEIYNTNKQINS